MSNLIFAALATKRRNEEINTQHAGGQRPTRDNPGMNEPHPETAFRARPWAAFAVSATGTFMATLDGGIVMVGLPVIAGQFGADVALAQWVITGYFLAISCLLPLFGRLGDMFGRRPLFIWAFGVFSLSSAACGAADSMGLLILARIIQGVGAAMLMANGPGVIMLCFPGPQKGRALGLVGMTVALGSLAGPALGGMLIEDLGWRSIFYLSVPIGILGLFLATRNLPRERGLTRQAFDYWGAALFALTITSLLLFLTNGSKWGPSSFNFLLCLALFLVGLGLFWRRERRTASPMLDFGLFKIQAFRSGNLASLSAFMGMFCNTIMLPFYLNLQPDTSPRHIGLIMALLPLSMGFVAPVSGYLSEKLNQAWLTGSGLSLTTLALLNQALLGAGTPIWRVLIGQILLGVGVGIFVSPNNNSILSSAPTSKAGMAGGIMALVRNLGMAGGIALATAVFETVRALYAASHAGLPAETSFYAGMHAAYLVAALCTAGGALLSFGRRGMLSKASAKA